MNNLIKKKLKIAKKTVKILQLVPYVRMIAICNSVAKGIACDESDIDLFIIAKNKHIFTVRYFSVFLLTIFKLKSYPRQKLCKDRISLSFFLSNNFLNLDRISQNKKEEKRRADWIKNLIPLFDENHTYLDFVDKNSWVKKFYPNYYLNMSSKTKNIKSLVILFIYRKMLEFVLLFFTGWIIEFLVRKIQLNKLFIFKHSHFGKERMSINDQMIKLHCVEDKHNYKLY